MKNYLHPLIIGLAIIITAMVLGNAWTRSHSQSNTINVTGLASKDFVSNLIVWQGNFSRKGDSIRTAYIKLQKDEVAIKKYLLAKGVSEKEVVFSSVDIRKEFRHIKQKDDNTIDVFDGYTLTQSVQIESGEVDKIEGLSREITELINQGIEFYSNPPQYYYTRLAELKIEMLANATADGKLRATQISKNAGNGLGDLKSANMGVFQITGQNSSEDYSYGGAFNTSSKNKTASITVKLEFGIR